MQLARVVVNWSGATVKGLAVNVLHFAADGGPPDPAAIKLAYQQLVSVIPGAHKISVPNSGEIIEDTTGTLTGVWSGTGGGDVNSFDNPNAAAGVGACVSLQTGGIINGRRLRGRIFLVPFSTVAYDTDGTLTTAAYGKCTDFAAGIMGSGPLAVWHRPTTTGGSDGNSYGVVATKVRDRVAFLSSRRD